LLDISQTSVEESRYIELTPEMLNHGVESKIAASQDSSQDTYEHNGVEVYRYPVFPEPNPNRIMDKFPWRF